MKISATSITANNLVGARHDPPHRTSASDRRAEVLVYAKRVADEDFRATANEIIHELCSPIYSKLGNAGAKIGSLPYLDSRSARSCERSWACFSKMAAKMIRTSICIEDAGETKGPKQDALHNGICDDGHRAALRLSLE